MARVISARYLADPCVFRDGDRFVAIGTSSHHANATGVAYREPDGAAFGVHETRDWSSEPWTYRGGLLAPLDLPQHWAPEVVITPEGDLYRDRHRQIWCFFSAGTDGEHWIYLATSPDMRTRFAVKRRITRGTDPHPHFDQHGALCLLYVTRWEQPGGCIVGARMRPDLSLESPPKRLLVPLAPWMRAGICRIAEGPFVQRIDGTNYLLFSGGGWRTNYGLDYAVSDDLLGEYAYDPATAAPRLLASDPGRGIIDPGHCSAIEVDGALYIAHQQWTDVRRTARQAVLRTLVCAAPGVLRVVD